MINKDLKVAVLGAGAMGCLFGGLLAEKGLNVILIDVWKEHVDAINKDGLKMDGHGGDRIIKVKATSDPSSLDKVDATKHWKKVMSIYNKIPFVKKINPDLELYVTEKTINGLFYILAEEEKEIRKNPQKRTTDLLKKVFGN